MVSDRYSTPQQDLIASYDFIDVLTGKAYTTLYAGVISGAYLRSFIFDSDEGNWYKTWAGESGGTYVRDVALDFDIEVDKNVPIEGAALCNLTVTGYNPNVALTYVFYVAIKIRKVNSAGTTEIAEGKSAVHTFSATATNLEQMRVGVNIDVPKTTYKVGETLRMTIEIWGKNSSAASNHYLGYDPGGRIEGRKFSGANYSTTKLYMPFKVVI